MLRLFLIAVALLAPFAVMRIVRWARRRATPTPQQEPVMAGTGDSDTTMDLAWLVRQIDAAATSFGPEQPTIDVAVPDELAVAIWGQPGRAADPVASAVLGDALRRARVAASRAGSTTGAVLQLTDASSEGLD